MTGDEKISYRANASREIKNACLNTGINVKNISVKTLREFYFRNFENYRREVVEMMYSEWNSKKSVIGLGSTI